MGDVATRNDNGTNVIFHANKKRVREFNNLLKKQQLVETPTLSTPSDKPIRELIADNLLSSSKEHSTVTNKAIVSKSSKNKAFKLNKKYKNSKDKDIKR